MCAWCNIYKYAVLAFVWFYKSQHSPQTPRDARGKTVCILPPSLTCTTLCTDHSHRVDTKTQTKTKKGRGEGNWFHFLIKQSKHSFKGHIIACSSLGIYLVSSPPAPGIALSAGGGAASPRTAVPRSRTPPRPVPAKPGTAAWCQRHPGPGDPAAGGPRATRATLVHVRWGGERRSVHPHPCAANERLPSLAADNEEPLLITHEVLIGWP